MENKKIKVKDLAKFIKTIKNDENGIGDEYECYNIAYQYLNFLSKHLRHNTEYEYNRDDLEGDLSCYADDFDGYLMEKNIKDLGLDCYEADELCELNNRIVKHLLPIGTDNCRVFCNLGALIKKYELDIDELYFDKDSNCIRDKDGNIGFD